MKLYNFSRSSASFRVRIALELKGLPYEYKAVHLGKGEHRSEAYRNMSPEVLVPMLDTGEDTFSQSMATIEYLNEIHPAPPLLPEDPLWRAKVRALAQSIACEIHPLNNLRVLQYLVRDMQLTEEQKNTWYHHWVRSGLESFERQLMALDDLRARKGLSPSVFCFGDSPTLADCLLIPQIFNGQRFQVNMDGLPRTFAAFDACMALPAFQRAQPSSCPDFE